MPLWTPADLAAPPRVWWNGDTTVFSGSNLSSWANSGSEGGSATIGGTPTQATLNGLNGVTFDAAGEKVSLTVGTWGSSGVMQFFDVSDPIAFATGVEGIMHRGSPATTSGLTVNVGVEIYIAAQGFASAPIAHSTSGMANTNPYLLFGSVGSTQGIWVNGTSHALDGDTAGGTFPNLASATWDFGEGWDPVNQNGANFQRLVFDYALTTDERQKLEGWAAWKYGLQASLPGGHPYASAAPTTPYTMPATVRTYALTGQTAGLRRVLRLAATMRTYALMGQPATTRKVYRLTAAQASFSLGGQASGLSRVLKLAAAARSYALTGQSATLTYVAANRRIEAASGALTLTGRDVTLRYIRRIRMSAETSAFALTGRAATFDRPDIVGSPVAIRSFTATAASNRSLTATPASTRSFMGTSI